MLRSFENRGTALALSVLLALGATACGSGGTTKSDKPPVQSTGNSANPNHTGQRQTVNLTPSIHITYFPDGTREIDLSGVHKTTEDVESIYEFCEDGTLYSQTEQRFAYSSASLAITRNYSACADGRLTPSDFSETPSTSGQ